MTLQEMTRVPVRLVGSETIQAELVALPATVYGARRVRVYLVPLGGGPEDGVSIYSGRPDEDLTEVVERVNRLRSHDSRPLIEM